MAHLLETNRTLDNKVKELENVLEAIHDDKADLYDKLQTVQKEKDLIQKDLDSVKDELVAYQTHVRLTRYIKILYIQILYCLYRNQGAMSCPVYVMI